MSDEDFPVDLDEFLYAGDNVMERKLDFYEAILASVIRKYVPANRKIELNLNHLYKDTYLDVTINPEHSSKVKIGWGEINAAVE